MHSTHSLSSEQLNWVIYEHCKVCTSIVFDRVFHCMWMYLFVWAVNSIFHLIYSLCNILFIVVLLVGIFVIVDGSGTSFLCCTANRKHNGWENWTFNASTKLNTPIQTGEHTHTYTRTHNDRETEWELQNVWWTQDLCNVSYNISKRGSFHAAASVLFSHIFGGNIWRSMSSPQQILYLVYHTGISMKQPHWGSNSCFFSSLSRSRSLFRSLIIS